MLKSWKMCTFAILMVAAFAGNVLAAGFDKEVNVKTGAIWRLKGVKATYSVETPELARCEYNGVLMVLPGDAIVNARVMMTDGSYRTLRCLMHITKSEGTATALVMEVPYNFAEDVLYLVNVERRKFKLHPYKLSEELNVAAGVRAEEISQYFSHTRPNGGEADSLVLDMGNVFGENIASGQATAEDVVRSWLLSPDHRGNVLHKEYKEMGVGCCFNPNGVDKARIYWVQLFRG